MNDGFLHEQPPDKRWIWLIWLEFSVFVGGFCAFPTGLRWAELRQKRLMSQIFVHQYIHVGLLTILTSNLTERCLATGDRNKSNQHPHQSEEAN